RTRPGHADPAGPRPHPAREARPPVRPPAARRGHRAAPGAAGRGCALSRAIRPDLRALLAGDPALQERVVRMLASDNATESVTTPAQVAALVAPLLAGHETERLVCVALDTRHRVIEAAPLTFGSFTLTVVDVRQILRWLLTRAKPAGAFVLAHNHPSGDPR